MPSLCPDHNLEISLLGGFDARLNGRSVAGVSYNKMRALLAYLAVEWEKDHHREFLAELFWGGNDPVTARGNLRRTLSDLRRVLESPSGKILFSTSKHTIRFIPCIPVDAINFIREIPDSPGDPGAAQRHEEKIIGLYRGAFLAGLSLPDNPDFEDWLQMQREALHRHALALLQQLSNHYAQLCDYGRAVQFALRHTDLEPWDEDAHCRVMRFYALGGQHSAAIGQYDICRRLLKSELGVSPSAKTRHLAECIRNGELRLRSADAVKAPPLQIVQQPPAERRQVTVMYCELTLDTIDDPDEAMTLLDAPQSRCAEIIRRFSGYIVQTHGGALLAYFGYPQAQEDAARRAVQAALAVTREAGHDTGIRAFVHSGLVIAGGESYMPDTVGKTSRLAIQLGHGTARDGVAISQSTHGIVAGYFDCISLGVQSLAGVSRPLEVFKVVGESGARSRLDAAARLTPLAGRQAEIAELMALWGKAAQGARQIALIQGEAGMGKSRLLHSLKERLAGQPCAIRELRCFREHCQSPFYPLIAMLESVFGFEHHDNAETKFGKMVAHLEAHDAESAPKAVLLLTRLLSLPVEGEGRASGFSPQKQKERTSAILLAMLRALAVQQPVLLIVEDLHWIDPSTLELLTLLVERTEREFFFAVFTARPEFVPPWKPSLQSMLALAPLRRTKWREWLPP